MKTGPIREPLISEGLITMMRNRVRRMRDRSRTRDLLPIVDAVEGISETLAGALLPSLVMRLEELERQNTELHTRLRRLESERPS